MPELKKQYGNQAIFVGVNMDEVDKKSELGRRADQSIGTSGQSIRSTGIVYTEMGAVTPGTDSKPGAFVSTCTLAGIGSNLMATLAEQTRFTNATVESTKGKFKLGPMEPREYARSSDRPQKQGEVKPKDVTEANKTVQAELTKARQAKTFDEAEKHYVAAIKASDSISMGQLEKLRTSLAQQQKEAEEKKDKAKSKELATQQQEIDDLLEAKSTTRKELGLACGRAGNPDAGVKWLAEAARRNKDFRDNPNDNLLCEMSPSDSGFKEKHQQDLLALLKKPEYAPITDDKIEVPKPPETAKSKMREIKTEADWKKALDDAKKEGKPIVVVGGYEDCFYCKKMDKAGTYDELVKKYGDKAIIVHIDPVTNEGSPQQKIGKKIADLFHMGSYPVTGVAAVKSDGHGGLTIDQAKTKEGFTEQSQYLDFVGKNIERARKLMPEPKKPKREPEPKSDWRDYRLTHLDDARYLQIPDIYGELS